MQLRVILASTIAGIYCALGARECWRGRAEALPSRAAVITLMTAYAAVYAVRIPVALAVVFMALTKERAEHEQRIAAETDPLTGIANRRAFMREAHLVDGTAPLALLVFDLDHFKTVNDRYGHGVGDAVLAGFSELALSLLPGTACPGRLGGEEFARVVPGIDVGKARRIAEGLRAGLARWFVAAYPDLRIRMSIGIAIRGAGMDSDFDRLAREADAALYRAKSNGRDRIEAAVASRDSLAAA